jgi:hypothetical protein
MTTTRGYRSSWSRRRRRMWWLLLVAGMLLACPREIREAPMEVASLHLECRPVSRGAACRLFGLSRTGTRPPQDVTAWAVWRLAGPAEMHLSPTEGLEASGMGDVIIATRYQSHTAQTVVRLTRGQPAQLLAVLRGTVYASDRGRLTPVAHARVEAVSGSRVGPHTTTRDDGTYELIALVPGHVVIHPMKNGFVATDRPVEIQTGDNRLSVVLFAAPQTGTLAL